MRRPLFAHVKRYWILPASILLLAASGEAFGETAGNRLAGPRPTMSGAVAGDTSSLLPVANQWHRPYLPIAPAFQYDHDTILQWFMTMTPRQQRRIGSWEHKAIINEHRLRHAEVSHLKKVLHDEFQEWKRANYEEMSDKRREEARYRTDQKRQELELARGPLD